MMIANFENQSTTKSPNWITPLLQIGATIFTAYALARLFEYLSESDEDEKTPRIFISHSFKHSKDYKNLIRCFDRYGFSYYNHSISEEKADLSLKTKQIESKIRNQLLYSRCLIVLGGKYAEKYWIKKEVEIAQELGKKIIAVKPRGLKDIPKYLKYCADEVVGFHSPAIIERIKF